MISATIAACQGSPRSSCQDSRPARLKGGRGTPHRWAGCRGGGHFAARGLLGAPGRCEPLLHCRSLSWLRSALPALRPVVATAPGPCTPRPELELAAGSMDEVLRWQLARMEESVAVLAARGSAEGTRVAEAAPARVAQASSPPRGKVRMPWRPPGPVRHAAPGRRAGSSRAPGGQRKPRPPSQSRVRPTTAASRLRAAPARQRNPIRSRAPRTKQEHQLQARSSVSLPQRAVAVPARQQHRAATADAATNPPASAGTLEPVVAACISAPCLGMSSPVGVSLVASDRPREAERAGAGADGNPSGEASGSVGQTTAHAVGREYRSALGAFWKGSGPGGARTGGAAVAGRASLGVAPVSALGKVPEMRSTLPSGKEDSVSRSHVVRAMVAQAMGPGSDDESAHASSVDESDVVDESLSSDSDLSAGVDNQSQRAEGEAPSGLTAVPRATTGRPAPLRTRRRRAGAKRQPASAAPLPFSPLPDACTPGVVSPRGQVAGRAGDITQPRVRREHAEVKPGELSFGQDVDLWPMLRSALRTGDGLHGSSTLTLARPASRPSADSVDDLADSYSAEGELAAEHPRLEFAAGEAAQLVEEARRVSDEWDELRASGIL